MLPGVAVIDEHDGWQARAACRLQDPELFYPASGTTDSPEARKALQICADCPVREACLEDALARRERHGIWGGTSPEQRVAMLRARRNLAARRAVAEQSWPLGGLPRRTGAGRVGAPHLGTRHADGPRYARASA
jgi:WhiB family redox-sensing transcriptional regulator